MSLVNDVLRDLQDRNIPITKSAHTVTKLFEKRLPVSTKRITESHRAYHSKTPVYLVLSVGFLLCVVALLQPARAPGNVGFASTASVPNQMQSSQLSEPDLHSSRSMNTADYPTKLVLASFRDRTETTDAIRVREVESPLPLNANEIVENQLKSEVAMISVPSTETSGRKTYRYENTGPNEPNESKQYEQISISVEIRVPEPHTAKVKNNVSNLSLISQDSTAQKPQNSPMYEKSVSQSQGNEPIKIVETPQESIVTEEKTTILSSAADPLNKTQKTNDPRPQTPSTGIAKSVETAEKSDDSFIEVKPRPLTEEQKLRKLYAVAVGDYKKDKFDEAALGLKNLLSTDSTQHKARHLLVKLYSEQGQGDQAEMILSEALTQFPHNAGYISLYAQLLAEGGSDNDALELLKNALPGISDNADLHALMAGLYQRTGNAAAAAESYVNAIQLDSERGEWWMGLGISNEQLGDRDTASIAYKEALQFPLATQLIEYVEQRLQLLTNKPSPTQNRNGK